MATPKSTPIQQLPQQLSPPTPPSESISSQMSTSINDLPNNQQPPNLTPENLQQPNDDNNQIVNEILSEIENTHMQQAPEDNQGGNVANFQRQMDPDVNNNALNPTPEEIREMQSEMTSEPVPEGVPVRHLKSPQPFKMTSQEHILDLLKNPIVVVMLVFVSHFAAVNQFLSKIPNAINSQGQVTIIGAAVKALLIGAIYFGLTRILH